MAPTPAPNDNDTLLREIRPALVKFFLRRCGNPAEAEDLAQDVVVRALAHGDWTSAEQVRGYIFKIATNRWRDRGRRQLAHGVDVEWDDEAGYAPGEEISTERVVTGQDALQKVSVALLEMNERTRDIFVLFRLEQMKQAEIAAMFGISVSAVEKHVVKALAYLSKYMIIPQ